MTLYTFMRSKLCLFPEPKPQDILSRFMLELNVIKNGLLNLLPGRRTTVVYPEELNISPWRTHGASVHRAGVTDGEGGDAGAPYRESSTR